MESKRYENQQFSELRMVLLGWHNAGISSTGNTILGSPIFKAGTAKFKRVEAEVVGREVVVIDTPGWRKNDIEISAEQNIVNSVCQCPPGPHALLFVIHLSTKFTPEQWSYVQRYMWFLGERAWEHVIVVFTGGDIFQGINIKPILKNKPCVQELLEKCGERYYLFNNKDRSNGTQVMDLLEGIEKMSSQHRQGFYEMNQKVAQNMEERDKALQEKVLRRQKDGNIFTKKAQRLQEVRVILLGAKKSGKTKAAKMMVNELQFREEKPDKCVAIKAEIDERKLVVVDTPGWSNSPDSPVKPEMITEAVSLCNPGPHAFLLVVNLNHNFKEAQRAAMIRHLACLPDNMWQNSMVLFLFGEQLQEENIQLHIEKEGEDLKWLVEKCGNRYHVFSHTPFDDLHQVRELLMHIDRMMEANSGQYFSNSMSSPKVKTDLEGSRNAPIYGEDEFTPREWRMMEKMIEMMRPLLWQDIKNYSNKGIQSASMSVTIPKMSQDNPTPSEDELRRRKHNPDSGLDTDRDDSTVVSNGEEEEYKMAAMSAHILDCVPSSR